MRLTLSVTHALPAETPALARLSAYATHADIDDTDAALIEASGAPAGTAVAPLAAIGAGFDPGNSYVLRADPVSLVAGRDDVLLAGRIDDLAVEEAQALAATLDQHFAVDGLAFHAPRPDAWFVTARTRVPVEADPFAINQPIHSRLPRGEHGGTWRRWLSEMQMLLHEHPVNAQREASGRAPVTGIWVSGGGVAPRELRVGVAVYASPGHASDVAKGLARLANTPVRDVPAELPPDDALVVIDDPGLAQRWIARGVAALDRGTIAELTLIAGTQRWRAARPSWWRRMRAPKA